VESYSTTYDAITKVLVDNITTRPFGAADTMSSGSGGVVQNEHDVVGRLKTANPGAERERRYTYDARGNHTGIHTPSTPWLNENFTFDALNRLESGTGPFGTFTYTYDKAGNRQSLTGYGVPEIYHYMPGTNRISYIEKYGQTLYSYDAAGNTTGIGSKTFVYNQNNRLARVLDNGVVLGEYAYNAMGQRVVKTVEGVDTVFFYGFDDKLIAESQSNGIFIAEYIHRGDNVIAKVECANNNIYHYLNDYLGQPKALVNDQEQAVWEANYLPFGQAIVNPNSSVENNLRLLGQYYDEETELHYNYHRYYDPKVGRYIRPDPIGLVGGVNLYGFANNNPANYTDEQGLIWQAGGALVAGGLLAYAIYKVWKRAENEDLPQKAEEFADACENNLEKAPEKYIEFLKAREKVLNSAEVQVGIPAAVKLGGYASPEGAALNIPSDIVSRDK